MENRDWLINKPLRHDVGEKVFWTTPWRAQLLNEAPWQYTVGKYGYFDDSKGGTYHPYTDQMTPELITQQQARAHVLQNAKNRMLANDWNVPSWQDVPKFYTAFTAEPQDINTYPFEEFSQELTALFLLLDKVKYMIRELRHDFKTTGELDYLVRIEPVRRSVNSVISFVKTLQFEIVWNLSKIDPRIVEQCRGLIQRAQTGITDIHTYIYRIYCDWKEEKADRQQIPLVPKQYAPKFLESYPADKHMQTLQNVFIDEDVTNMSLEELRQEFIILYNQNNLLMTRLYEIYRIIVNQLRPQNFTSDLLYVEMLKKLPKKLSKDLDSVVVLDLERVRETINENNSRDSIKAAITMIQNRSEVVEHYIETLDRIRFDVQEMNKVREAQ